MSLHKHESSQDSYERFLQRRAASAQDSYERYLRKKKNQPVGEDTQPIYRRKLSAEQQRKKRMLYIVLIAAVAVVIFSVALLIRGIVGDINPFSMVPFCIPFIQELDPLIDRDIAQKIRHF